MSVQRLYAVKSPSQILLWNTASSTRAGAWDAAYRKHLWRSFNGQNNPTKAAYARGWRCVPVRIVEIKGEA